MLPFLRALIDGPTPLHVIEKPSPGSGAMKLVSVVSIVATGAPASAMTESTNEEEWRKRITAVLLDAPVIVLIDNVHRRLDSAALSAAITATEWKDRIMGQSATVTLPVTCTWIATGNNPAFSNELARRTVRIRLDPKVDRPWLRTGFKHEQLENWATAHRAELVWAALAIGQAWISAGMPRDRSARLGQFDDWAPVMGGVRVPGVAGVPGFLGNLAEFGR